MVQQPLQRYLKALKGCKADVASLYLYVRVTIDAVDHQVMHIVRGLQDHQGNVGGTSTFHTEVWL